MILSIHTNTNKIIIIIIILELHINSYSYINYPILIYLTISITIIPTTPMVENDRKKIENFHFVFFKIKLFHIILHFH
jgi:hypothetical protein